MKVRMAGQLLETTLGRIIFNEAMPEGFPFVNEQMTSKKLEKLCAKVIREYPNSLAQEMLDKVKEIGFEYATLSGVTWGMDDLVVPKEKGKLIADAEHEIETVETHFTRGLLSREEKTAKVIEIWQRVKS